MRIAIGEIAHETNTFRAGVTSLAQFRAQEWEQGAEMLEKHRGVRDFLGGMIAAGEALGIETVPTFAASAQPSATIAREAFATMRDELLAGLRNAGSVDAICLALHGAGSAEGVDDIEGAVLAAVRSAVGPDVPLVVTLDLHGHMTAAMIEHADLLLNCHEYPHIDCYERGAEAIDLAARLVRGEIQPRMHLETLPMMIPPATTMEGPGKAITEACLGWEARPGLIDCAFVHGFPHTDVPIMATSVLATADGDADLARTAAQAVARQIWEMREAFRADLPGVVEAVQMALATEAVPVVIAEVSDNSGGGAPADGTRLLGALLQENAVDTCFGFLTDPEVARQAHEAGVGATIAIRLGGKTDALHGAPLVTTAYVKCLTDGRFRYTTPMGAGSQEDLGPMARLVIGNVDVLVASIRSQTLDAEVFLLHGIDVSRYRIVALKSTQHFRAGFAHLAGTIIRCDPPGITTSTLDQLPYQRVRRPIWPLDDASAPAWLAPADADAPSPPTATHSVGAPHRAQGEGI